MSAISDYAAQVKEHHDSISSAVDSIVASVNGLSGDIQRLKKTIDDLQDSPGQITPEDQALLNAAVQQASAAAAKTKAVADAVKALDEETEESVTPPPV